ncbi:hypothetical protein EDD18DRAFT_1462010 [Armillaria luteobubalina]|uniref:F-box domain-containing protein n=1 Tax=Armillaria luteobubalina TaxID=153913 RepID=A0AA39Q7S0_9AGAR|nr:hypothetical protein EDD18DRAFT_1462010 [Armillaria luteobubalina]
MTLPTIFPSNWHPCNGCACVNHNIPSYKISVTDADSPIANHPDLGKLTRINDAPTPPEEKILQGMISDSGKHIDTIDVHVLELKTELNKERQRLSERVRERRLLLSGFRRIPKEVLAHIFLHTLIFPFPRIQHEGPPTNLTDWSMFFASKHPLLSFELVSRNWKDVLGTFSYLWSYVNILIDRMSSVTYTRYFGNQLSRSRLSPLSVSICHGDSGSVTRLGAFPVAITMALFAVSCRVQALHLCLPGRYFPSMQQLYLSFPALRELVLLSSSETSEVAQYLHFGSLPNLRVFHATDVSNVDRLFLPWNQLTHFTNVHEVAGRGLPAPRALSILRMMSRVSVCRLSLDVQFLATRVAGHATLSKLHSLTLSSVYRPGFGSPSLIPSVLNSFMLPTLLDLSVTCLLGSISPDQAGTFASIRQLIERFRSPLTSLYFDNRVITTNDLIHLLSITPTLQDLRLTNTKGITNEFPNFLSCAVSIEPDLQAPAVVPHLHTLHLSGYLVPQVEVYVQMVESRWTCHPRHLKSVNICQFVYNWSWNDTAEGARILALSRLDVLRSEGVDVDMSMRLVSD